MDLVPGRDCNECAVCCTTLLIDTPQFQKTPGSPCKHLCAGGGCSIYAERPSVCRNFHCAWRYFDILGDDWRPDRSGVLLMFVREHQLPPGYEKGLFVYVSAQSADKLNPSIYDFVARLIAAGVLIVLAVNGPPGSMPAVAYLNEQLQDAAEAHDLGRIEAAFSEALALSSAQQRPAAVVQTDHTFSRRRPVGYSLILEPRCHDGAQERSWNSSGGGVAGALALSVGSKVTPLTFSPVARDIAIGIVFGSTREGQEPLSHEGAAQGI